jgi:transcriptional regulator with XRE-family HTH domain
MRQLGDKLRQLREARGVDLQQVASSTKIGLRHLDALERGDLDALPDDVFVRGYIRAYAAFLGADSEALLAEYRRDGARCPDPERTLQEMSRLLESRPVAARAASGRRPARVVVAAVAMVVAVSWVAVRYLRVEREPSAVLAGATVALPRPSPPSRAAPVAAPAAAKPAAPALPSTTEPAPPPAAEPESGLRVADHGVGLRIENGDLAERARSFHEGDVVWYWTRVEGGGRGDSVRHVWLRDGREVGGITLELGGSSWRTRSQKSMQSGAAGSWTVEARDERGRVLARDAFQCRPSS